MTDAANGVVLDASAMVDLLTGAPDAASVGTRLTESTVYVPAHFDAEVLSALGRLCRAGALAAEGVPALLAALARAPFARHPLHDLVAGAWQRRDNFRLVDALYVELAEQLRMPLVTTDTRLVAAFPGAQRP